MNLFFAVLLAAMILLTVPGISNGEVPKKSVPAQVQEFVDGITSHVPEGVMTYWTANQKLADDHTFILNLTVHSEKLTARFVLTLVDGVIVNIAQLGVLGAINKSIWEQR